ncbi:hypothetical protein FB451DRAFT_240815 [Mycena latifolia]|nr:hypothetical protein FB451DRAFT_240815 [Mycena latifolia]
MDYHQVLRTGRNPRPRPLAPGRSTCVRTVIAIVPVVTQVERILVCTLYDLSQTSTHRALALPLNLGASTRLRVGGSESIRILTMATVVASRRSSWRSTSQAISNYDWTSVPAVGLNYQVNIVHSDNNYSSAFHRLASSRREIPNENKVTGREVSTTSARHEGGGPRARCALFRLGRGGLESEACMFHGVSSEFDGTGRSSRISTVHEVNGRRSTYPVCWNDISEREVD